MDLATLLLRAADVLAQREEADSASDDYTVPDARPSGVRSQNRKLKTSPHLAPEPEEGYRSGAGSGSEDDGAPAVPHHRGGANARHGARKVGGRSRRGPMQHNEVEKRRRAYLAACYVELKRILPSVASSKASNVSILRAAVSKIQSLEQQERELDAERAALYEERRMLLSRRAAGPGIGVQSQLVLCLIIVILAMVSAGSLPIKDCGSKGGKVTSITLDPPPVGSCTFPRGKNVSATLDVEIDEVTSKLTVKCKGDVVVWVPFPLPNDDACSQGVTCPTISGTSYSFKTVIPILQEYPALRLVVQLEFQDDNGDDAICVQFPGQIC